MKTNKVLTVVAVSLLLQSSTGLAEFRLGNFDLTASVKAGYQLSNGAENQSAKFAEYRDIRDSFLGYATLSAESNSYHLDFEANRVGLDDQSYVLSGGNYGGVKYKLFFDSLIHNYSFNNKTFYSGVGTNNYTYDDAVVGLNPTNASLWPTTFDYSTKTKTFGVNALYPTDGNYFVSLGYSNVNKDGLRVTDMSLGTPGSAFVELPEPVDYKTNNFSASTGYRGEDFIFVLDGNLSNFDNAFEYFNVRRANIATTNKVSEVHSLPPDNKYWSLGSKATWRDLPLNSTLSAKLGYSKITNTLAIPTTMGKHSGATGDAVDLTSLMSGTEFKGDYAYGSAGVSYASSPVEKLETKVFYNFLRKWNNSTQISFTGASGATNKLFWYYKHNLGIDADYELPFDTKIGGGFEYLNVHRNRHDAESNKDKIYFVELQNDSLDFVTAKLKYQRLNRSSENANLTAGTGQADSLFVRRFSRFFDAADKKQDVVKTAFELSPIEHLDLSLEAAWQFSKYSENEFILGRTKDTGRDFYADIGYEMPKLFRVNAFGHYGRNTFNSGHWKSASGQYDPTQPSGTNFYNWTADREFQTWGYGLGLDVPVIENQWDFSAGFEQNRGNGRAVFAHNATAALATGAPESIEAYDDYLRNTLNVKTKYAVTDNLSAIVGYMYEKGQLDDIAYDYSDLVLAGTRGYMSGYGIDNDYNAHVGYLMAEYRF